MERTGLRSWGGAFTTGLAFPAAALAAALLVFATAGVSAGLVGALVVALVPWALLAGRVRVGPWVMAVAGTGVPAFVCVAYAAPGATFLALLAVAWLAALGESAAAEALALAGALLAPVAFLLAHADWRDDYPAAVFFGTGSLLSWLIGRILRRERLLVAALTEAQGRLDAAAAAAERRRIAVDVHDAVGHGLSVVLLNVAGARQVLDRDPATAAEALERAERVGRESLESVRGIVGLLRDPGGGERTPAQPPPPGAGDIMALLETVAASGMAVRADLAGDLSTVDGTAGLAAYRVVQEAMSNVEHHAPGAETSVRVAREAGRLVITVRNGAARRPTRPGDRGGTGLSGMRQRVSALGGTVLAGPDGDGWLVEAVLPLGRPAAEVTG